MIKDVQETQKKKLNLRSIRGKLSPNPLDSVPNLSVQSSDNKLISDMKNTLNKLDNIDKIQISKIKENLHTNNSEEAISKFLKYIRPLSANSWIKTDEILLYAKR